MKLIESYAQNSIDNERLSDLSVLDIESDFEKVVDIVMDFDPSVIYVFQPFFFFFLSSLRVCVQIVLLEYC